MTMSRFVRHTPRLEEAGEHDFRAIKARFVELNRQRLRRARADLRTPEREFLDLLPLLFHVNHPALPGYVDRDTPAGLPDFSPAAGVLRSARRRFRSFAWRKRAYRRFEIQSLFMMGSTGTIAFSEGSDFDIWICHAEDLAAEQVKRLEVKTAAIEQWARGQGVEANLFLVDPAAFRAGDHGPLGPENTGSALHYLLLDEFYRTSVLLAGRTPLWWLVPPEEEADYDTVAADIKRKRLVHAREHIDLGGLNRVGADEFYGATLWLLYKSIHAPYKSLLKILLMEAYATEYPRADLLGLRFKQAVYAGEADIDKLDPYLMMLDKVEDYLTRAGQPERLALARRSFYFKVGLKLSEARGGGWRRELLQARVDGWGWHPSQLVRLDTRAQWKLEAVLAERRELIREFTQTYRYLSLFARTKSEGHAIRAEDLTVLGRKLYAAFERKAGKIDIVYQGITPDLHESHVSFHELTREDGRRHWMVFSGVVPPADVGLHAPLKRDYSLMALLAWCHFNRIIDRRTVIALYSSGTDLSERELLQIVEHLCRIFPDGQPQPARTDDLRRAERIRAVLTVIDLGLDPFAAHTRRGEHLTSSRTDALKYGGRLENLALSLDQVLVTSWQQVLTFRYTGAEGLMQCLQDFMRWAPPDGRRPPPLNAVCHSTYRGPAIARRIEALFATLYAVFDRTRAVPGTRFVLGIEWDYFVLWQADGELRYANPGELDELKAWLGRPRARHAPTVFDAETPADQILPLIYRHDRPGWVQCFYERRGDSVQVWVVDERGSLAEQTHPLYDVVSLVRQYREFFDATLPRLRGADGPAEEAGVEAVHFYRIERDSEGRRTVVQHSLNAFLRSAPYLRLQAIVDRIDGEPSYTLVCGEQEFSSLEHGADLFRAVARHILALRRDGEAYPIHVTDVDLAPRLLAEDGGHVQTVRYLHCKQRIESRLQAALAELV